jgi:hypothetical protein
MTPEGSLVVFDLPKIATNYFAAPHSQFFLSFFIPLVQVPLAEFFQTPKLCIINAGSRG